jgi:hypothetical protein
MLSKRRGRTEDGEVEVAVGLRAGLPTVVWSREDCDSDEFLIAVWELLHGGGLGDVLQRVKQVRTAYQLHVGHVGRSFALMWDDPERLVVPADLGPPRDPREAA